MKRAASTFLANKRIAVTGVSQAPKGGWWDRYHRWMYRGGRPNWWARPLNRLDAALGRLMPSRMVILEVNGRRSGRRVSLPLAVADYEGERYLVAMLGQNANWVRNVRAAHGRVLLRRGRRREVVHLDEVVASARAPILRRYLERAPGARAHIPVDRRAPVAEFDRIAELYPVFRIAGDGSRRRSADAR